MWSALDMGHNVLCQGLSPKHEYYKELLNDPNLPRISEEDAEESHLEDEKVYEEDEM